MPVLKHGDYNLVVVDESSTISAKNSSTNSLKENDIEQLCVVSINVALYDNGICGYEASVGRKLSILKVVNK